MAVESRLGPSGVAVRAGIGLFAIVCAIPFWYVITVSFSDPFLVQEGQLLLFPKSPSLRAYEVVLGDVAFYRAALVSIVRTALGVVTGLSVQTMMAYALSRPVRGRRSITLLVIFAFAFNAGIVPTYLVVRATGLVDTIWALIVPPAVLLWNVLILLSFFNSLPESIIESAKIDGANDIVIFVKLVVPLSVASIATIALFIAVFHWNSLVDAVIYINKPSLRPMQLYLMDVVVSRQMQDMFGSDAQQNIPPVSVQTAAVFVGTLPIMLVYPFIQKHFIKGIMLGAIKQ